MSDRYCKSEAWLERAQKSIPLGSQTFSKSKTQYPFGVSPYFLERGQGSHVWDLDGNEYIDFINSLAAVTLGYNDPDVNAAVHKQLDQAVILSLPLPLEALVAEEMRTLVPCAEQVRFAKNGSDATSGAIRLARAYTRRDHVAACGYHGWQDWYIGATARNAGVPAATTSLTHLFTYNDLGSLENIFRRHPGNVAAVILEPMNVAFPENDFLAKAQEIAKREGAVFIFDETITGFRFAEGGAQQLFGITPDLATFGKGLANGFPVSAVAGKAEIMRLMEEIFFSFTFGGEALSLAAALACMKKLKSQPVIATMRRTGEEIMRGVQQLIAEQGLEHIFSVSGHPTWSFFVIKDQPGHSQYEIKTLYLQEMFRRGILTLATHNISYSHSAADIKTLLSAYAEVLAILKEGVMGNKMSTLLACRPLEPLFKVR